MITTKWSLFRFASRIRAISSHVQSARDLEQVPRVFRSSRGSLQPNEYQTVRAETLTLYRALLRESSYYPDKEARHWIRAHIVRSFRRNVCITTTQKGRQRLTKVLENRSRRIDRGKKRLSILRRANAGHEGPLLKTLRYAYGRLGPRRRQLVLQAAGRARCQAIPPQAPRHKDGVIESFIPPAWRNMIQSKDRQSIDSILASHPPTEIDVVGAGHVYWKTERRDSAEFLQKPSPVKESFLALMKSQLGKRASIDFPSPTLRNLHPYIPRVNSWGRPMPLKRVRNIQLRWYRDALQSTAPPLPKAEWDSLYRRARGLEPVSITTHRRRRRSDDCPDLAYEAAMRPYRTQNGTISNPKCITARSMRRLWTTILRATPLLEETLPGKYEVRWANVAETKITSLRPAPLIQRQNLFAGVSATGDLLEGSQRTQKK